ncbi:MAG: hypothetical protein NBV66_12405 [Burkholderiaceae bacterium]|nr:hypothetical protein [Burkholderiaceae bacterium]
MTTTSPLSRKTSQRAKGAKAQASKASIIAAAKLGDAYLCKDAPLDACRTLTLT